MQDILIGSTQTSPEVNFSFSKNTLLLRGESYPENAASFFAPIIEALHDYLEHAHDQVIDVTVELTYFNSSSTKVLFNMFDMLNTAAKNNTVHLYWRHDADDDTILEFGDDLHEDFPNINYIPESFES